MTEINFFKGQNGMPEIKNIFNQDISQEAFAAKEGFELVNSDFLKPLRKSEFTNITPFTAAEWNAFSSEEQQKILLQYRLTYLAETEVNWCPALGTVLANDEIVNGVSERGGHPVIRKKMTQWSMRISAYAERLLQGLETIDWSESIKESQRNWIGKSVGASVSFRVIPSAVEGTTTNNQQPTTIDVFTTRPDTIFGVTFMTLAPEHELVSQITTPEPRPELPPAVPPYSQVYR